MRKRNIITNCIASRGIETSRILSGTFMTSLDGPGFSITLLKAAPEMLKLLDAPTDATGWSASNFAPDAWKAKTAHIVEGSNLADSEEVIVEGTIKRRSSVRFFQLPPLMLNLVDTVLFQKSATLACKNVIAAESLITQYDTIVGDGDCGITLARGAQAILSFIGSPELKDDAVQTLLRLANVIEESMDGTSGAIYSIFFAALAAAVRNLPSSTESIGIPEWAKVTGVALSQLKLATPARQGDRTLMDALEPFVESLSRGEALVDAVAKAVAGADATKGMKAAFGRAVYVEKTAWGEVTDPGAEGVVALLKGIAGIDIS